MPRGLDSRALFAAALDERIAIAPGTLFSASDRYRHCIRLTASMAAGLAFLDAA